MSQSRRDQTEQALLREVLSLLLGATADDTTVTVTRRYTVLGQPMQDSWTGYADGFAHRIALALHRTSDQDGPDDPQTPLRDRLGEALIAAGAVPATMPVEIFAQAGTLADAVLPIVLRAMESAATVHRRAGFQAAVEVMRQEKLPMSVGLLEAQLELEQLDFADAQHAHNTAPAAGGDA